MPLMDSEQFDEEHHRVVFSQPMSIAPLRHGLVELLVEVGLFVVRHGEAVKLGWAHGALLTTFPGDTTMATLEQVQAFARGGSARIQR